MVTQNVYDLYLEEDNLYGTITNAASATDAMREKATAEATSKYLACLFLCTFDNKRYHALKLDLSNKHVLGDDKYPTTLESVQQIMNEYTPLNSSRPFPINHQEHVGEWHSC